MTSHDLTQGFVSSARNRGKKFMLSAFESVAPDPSDGSGVVGYYLTVKCRLFQRGDGWSSLQSFLVFKGQGCWIW